MNVYLNCATVTQCLLHSKIYRWVEYLRIVLLNMNVFPWPWKQQMLVKWNYDQTLFVPFSDVFNVGLFFRVSLSFSFSINHRINPIILGPVADLPRSQSPIWCTNGVRLYRFVIFTLNRGISVWNLGHSWCAMDYLKDRDSVTKWAAIHSISFPNRLLHKSIWCIRW